LDRLDVGPGLSLVVGGAAGDDPVALRARLARRLERWMAPLVERVGPLNVVVAVEAHRRRLRAGTGPLRVDQRVAGGGDLAGLEAGLAHALDQPVGAAGNIGGVGRIGGNRRDAQVLLELLEIAPLVTFDAGENVLAGVRHGNRSSFPSGS